ncbi:MAG: polyribonucleotide nucleotidyltransferase [Chloroflexota bacterium]
MIHHASARLGAGDIQFETGRVARLADGAVTVRYGDSVVLATVVGSHSPREGIDFFPLTVDYEERMYAAGKIPGGFIKREGRASQQAILTCRLTDRPIRPLFPKGYKNEVQIIVTVLSADQENDPDVLAINGASAALSLSDIPWMGPVGAVRVGYVDGEFIINPTFEQLKHSRLDLVIAGTTDAVMMVEAGALEMPENLMLEGVQRGHEALRASIQAQEELIRLAGRSKRGFNPPAMAESTRQEIKSWLAPRLEEAMFNPDKASRERATADVAAQLKETFRSRLEAGELIEKELSAVLGETEKSVVRGAILQRQIRVDGRGLTEVRPVSCEVGILPRTHGTGLFTRGQTQVLSVLTLGAPGDKQMIDDISPEESKRFMHQYNFPPFSTGEVKRLGAPGRREVGHGALVERSISAVLPPQEEFPYVVRIVSEVLSSNGSSSMGSVCGSTMALMDGGVPIKAPVSGVAMGLITGEDGNYAILTDIQGVEDALGDMDFKVAGTAEGVTGLQMDIKVKGITYEIMEKALAQAKEARAFIMSKMLEAIPQPREEMSPYAPRILTIHINPEKIGALIGPGGKNIRKITDETGVSIDIEDDGRVMIASTDGAAKDKAVAMIQAITEDVEVGKKYHGTVKRLMNFGAFVEILPGKEGLVHISDLAAERVNRVEDVIHIGDQVDVVVKEIDTQGRVNLSRKAALPGYDPASDNGDRGPRPSFGGGGGGGYRDRERSGFGGGGGGGGGYRDRPPAGGGGFRDRDRGPSGGSGYRDRPPGGGFREREGGARDRGPVGGGYRDRPNDRPREGAGQGFRREGGEVREGGFRRDFGADQPNDAQPPEHREAPQGAWGEPQHQDPQHHDE